MTRTVQSEAERQKWSGEGEESQGGGEGENVGGSAEDEVLRDFSTFLIWPKDQDKAENRADVITEVCKFCMNYIVLTIMSLFTDPF